MINFNIGQKVKAIDDDTRGVVTKIEEDIIWIENEYGFDESYSPNELLPDVELEEEIEEISIETFRKNQEREKISNSKKDEKLKPLSQKELELQEMIEENLVENSEAYRQKLEEKYKKEIKVSKKRKGTFVLDLHYNKLEKFSKQLPTNHILEKQLTAAINGIEKAKNEGFKKIILVHGKGKGILENEIKKYLTGYGYTFYDADFTQYKLGATEVEL